jgi:hypothetical protein
MKTLTVTHLVPELPHAAITQVGQGELLLDARFLPELTEGFLLLDQEFNFILLTRGDAKTGES